MPEERVVLRAAVPGALERDHVLGLRQGAQRRDVERERPLDVAVHAEHVGVRGERGEDRVVAPEVAVDGRAGALEGGEGRRHDLGRLGEALAPGERVLLVHALA